MTIAELKQFCSEVAEIYGAGGYNEAQTLRLYSFVRFCSLDEARKALDMMFLQEMKFPSIPTLISYLRTVMVDARERRRLEVIAKKGHCEVCHDTGIVTVVLNSDRAKNEKSMRCGECEMAEVIGVLRNQPTYTHLGSKGIEPVIYSLSLNANPGKGRLDEIKAMPSDQREQLLDAEPHLRWALAFYGNKSIPIEPVHRPKYSPWDDPGGEGQF